MEKRVEPPIARVTLVFVSSVFQLFLLFSSSDGAMFRRSLRWELVGQYLQPLRHITLAYNFRLCFFSLRIVADYEIDLHPFLVQLGFSEAYNSHRCFALLWLAV